MLYPKNFEQKIDFDQIKQGITQRCESEVGMEEIARLQFSYDFKFIITQLLLIDESMTLLRSSSSGFPLGRTIDLHEAFLRTKHEGTFLELKDVVNLRTTLTTLSAVLNFIQHQEAGKYPNLTALVEPQSSFPQWLHRIDKIINTFGDIKDTASPELHEVRRQMVLSQGAASKTLYSIMRQAQNSGIVDKDIAPTLREGRLVIPVPFMNKRQIPGIIHDESATGKTVYLEPSAVVEVNNRLRELEREEHREIVRILLAFTNELKGSYEAIEQAIQFLGQLDALRAKAKYGIETHAIRPHLSSKCGLDWVKARHPLLEKKLKSEGKHIEPLDIKLTKTNRILLISGPNAGGKSICLKTVALLQYMVQCGLPIPVDENSRVGLFEHLFIDMGDEQSIENDLSTYSGHLINMKYCLKNSTPKTLILFDEFGTGTEPQIGGAIAESVLENLNKIKVFGVITTHYSNLKTLASETDGIINGAMLYDRHQMAPLFSLAIGSPGSSFALEIAQKIGLPKNIVEQAKEKLGSDQVDYDKYLQDVVRDKRYWKQKRDSVKNKEKELNALTLSFEKQLKQIHKIEKEIVSGAKREASYIIKDAGSKIEKTIREIKESNADKTISIQARQELKTLEGKLDQDLKREARKARSKPTTLARPLQKGDAVRIIGQDMTGEIISISGKNATIAFGLLKSLVPLKKLEYISKTQLKSSLRKTPTISKETSDNLRKKQLDFKLELDLRGMRVDEALSAVAYYIDDALMFNLSRVRLLHGTGTGALRQSIREYLQTLPGISAFHDEQVQFGGAGITVVEF